MGFKFAKTSNQYETVNSANPPKTTFDLSYNKKMTMQTGLGYITLCEEMVPGDTFTFGQETVIRAQPTVAPMLQEINYKTEYYFVPYRICWKEWQKYITGGADGQDATPLPKWEHSEITDTYKTVSVWDTMGFSNVNSNTKSPVCPIDMPLRAYWLIWNAWYRDQDLDTYQAGTNPTEEELNEIIQATEFGEGTEMPIATHGLNLPYAAFAFQRKYEKDYFTSARPWQQKGVAPIVPVINNGWGINDARTATQVQLWLERNARSGSRYIEFLKAHFGCAPKDKTLQRPELIGRIKKHISISEVLQTSESGNSPQGNMAGHGLLAEGGMVGEYHAEEYGIIMAISGIVPKRSYTDQTNRQWIKNTRYDFYSPEFANLGEQEIYKTEIAMSNVDAENEQIFGFQGRWDEMRIKNDIICGMFKSKADAGGSSPRGTSLDYWHMGKSQWKWSDTEGWYFIRPNLNADWPTIDPKADENVRGFAVQDEDQWLCNIGNVILANGRYHIWPNQAEWTTHIKV